MLVFGRISVCVGEVTWCNVASIYCHASIVHTWRERKNPSNKQYLSHVWGCVDEVCCQGHHNTLLTFRPGDFFCVFRYSWNQKRTGFGAAVFLPWCCRVDHTGLCVGNHHSLLCSSCQCDGVARLRLADAGLCGAIRTHWRCDVTDRASWSCGATFLTH